MQKNKVSNFKAVKPTPITLQQTHLVSFDHLSEHEQFPLVISPQHADVDLVEWTQHNLSLLEQKLLKYGAILFRGFHILKPENFERFALAITPELFGENGEHVQAKGVGNGNLYTPVFYAPEKKLLWHNENSFNHTWPMKIWFYCARPADKGGETPIVDSRKVFQVLDSEIRDVFTHKNIMYVRNYGEGLGLSWQTIFRTSNKREVEAYCHNAAIEFEWKNNDRLKTYQIRPAVLQHPKTGEWVWWNQATHWHPSCLDQTVRDSLQNLFTEEDLPRTCYYGDGTPIEDAAIEAICNVYQQTEISFPWQTGDILMLDNMLAAHARNPFQGERKIYVSLGEMINLKQF